MFDGMRAIDIAAMLTSDRELLLEFSQVKECKSIFTELDAKAKQAVIDFTETKSRKVANVLRRISMEAKGKNSVS